MRLASCRTLPFSSSVRELANWLRWRSAARSLAPSLVQNTVVMISPSVSVNTAAIGQTRRDVTADGVREARLETNDIERFRWAEPEHSAIFLYIRFTFEEAAVGRRQSAVGARTRLRSIRLPT